MAEGRGGDQVGVVKQRTRRPGLLARLAADPRFWCAMAILAAMTLAAVAPRLFTDVDPRAADLHRSLEGAAAGHPLGFNRQGQDIWARIVHGAGRSLLISVPSTVLAGTLGIAIGAVAGFVGGWVDTVLTRLTEVAIAIPMYFAAIALLHDSGPAAMTGPIDAGDEARMTMMLILLFGVLGFPVTARLTRSAVRSVANDDYVRAALALGRSRTGVLLRHVLPNCLGPVIAFAATLPAGYILSEAGLSYLGLGVGVEAVSWGRDISAAEPVFATDPAPLLWPAAALTACMFAFLMLGDALKAAFDDRAVPR
ncbi:ABC transporter permease [Corynebacterium freneyi]|uniref:ABC transporter permease n=1 Tax=Corynebacterium freneyi TaxID=134034 RepID=UPI001EF25AD9|nr:ABC transporter permease [Corynebacterium freneyi]MCG7439876.1 ABC transporter permease [Corynebacterium freneyi]